MQFSSKEDIEAPIAEVFELVSEFESFERSALRRGVEVQRVDASMPKGAGLAWDTVFMVRGKPREMHLELVEYTPPTMMRFESHSKGVEGKVVIELLALSSRRTRLSFDVSLSANTLAARLLLQSLKLARANLSQRFRLKLAEFARDIEERHTRRA